MHRHQWRRCGARTRVPGPEGAFRGKRGPGGGRDDGRTEHDAAPRSRVGCRATSEGERSGVRSCDHVGWPPRGVASRRRRVELSLCGEPEVRDFAGSSAVTITPRAAVLPGGPCEQRMARSGGRSQEGVQNPPPLWTPQPLCPGFDHRGEHGHKTGTRARALAGMASTPRVVKPFDFQLERGRAGPRVDARPLLVLPS